MDEIEIAEKNILNPESNISRKMRSLYYLRNLPTVESALIIGKVFAKEKSVLLKHEAAYVLGQMKIPELKQTLIGILENTEEDEVVRHEAAEALGNYEDQSLINVLSKYIQKGDEKSIPVQETCSLAIEKLKENRDELSPFDSYDPALPLISFNIDEAEKIFLDENEIMYKRYAVMFYLRNLGTPKAIEILGKGLRKSSSSLFKHEIAFVFGQIGKPECIKYMKETVVNDEEHGMVRHECAEALGSIGTEEAKEILTKCLNSTCDILRESAEVALDIHDYENNESFEYCAA